MDIGEHTVSLQSLDDLVDVAIDIDKRVIYDVASQKYTAIDGQVVCVSLATELNNVAV